MPSHYSKASNYYLDILVLTIDDLHDFILILMTRGSIIDLFTMASWRSRMIHSIHLALVPHQGVMAGNVLVLGVVVVLEAVCLC